MLSYQNVKIGGHTPEMFLPLSCGCTHIRGTSGSDRARVTPGT